MTITRNDVLKANIKLHTQLVDVYRDVEPHYRPENQIRVDKILANIAPSSKNGRLLDIGCGMGFIIDIAKKHFAHIHGIDITEAMLQRVNTISDNCDISLCIAEAEDLPFLNQTFDVVSAYAVIHHLHSLQPAFEEIYRVLKPGGFFYTDTDPNFYFWDAIRMLPQDLEYSSIIKREVDAILHKDIELTEKFGVASGVLTVAEILKHDSGGFKAEDLEFLLRKIGFSQVSIHYEWFLGEARVIHSEDMSYAIDSIRLLMHELLPMSRHLFKYVRIMAQK
ncbi:MAG: class I SAM-dependent methyltransferase [Chlorobium sp.]